MKSRTDCEVFKVLDLDTGEFSVADTLFHNVTEGLFRAKNAVGAGLWAQLP